MSSTGRGKQGKPANRSNGNADSDYCPTPAVCARVLTSLLPIGADDLVVDAGAGQGVFSQAVYDLHGASPRAVDAFADRYPGLHTLKAAGVVREVVKKRFQDLRASRERRPDWIVSNPPFSQAEEFVTHALFLAREGGHVAVLLRHGFLVTADRAHHRRRFPPFRIYDMQTRPQFYGNGSDSAEYAWIVYRKGWQGRTISDVLHWNAERYPSQVEDDLRRIRAADWPDYGLTLTPDAQRVRNADFGIDAGATWRASDGSGRLMGREVVCPS